VPHHWLEKVFVEFFGNVQTGREEHLGRLRLNLN